MPSEKVQEIFLSPQNEVIQKFAKVVKDCNDLVEAGQIIIAFAYRVIDNHPVNPGSPIEENPFTFMVSGKKLIDQVQKMGAVFINKLTSDNSDKFNKLFLDLLDYQVSNKIVLREIMIEMFTQSMTLDVDFDKDVLLHVLKNDAMRFVSLLEGGRVGHKKAPVEMFRGEKYLTKDFARKHIVELIVGNNSSNCSDIREAHQEALEECLRMPILHDFKELKRLNREIEQDESLREKPLVKKKEKAVKNTKEAPSGAASEGVKLQGILRERKVEDASNPGTRLHKSVHFEQLDDIPHESLREKSHGKKTKDKSVRNTPTSTPEKTSEEIKLQGILRERQLDDVQNSRKISSGSVRLERFEYVQQRNQEATKAEVVSDDKFDIIKQAAFTSKLNPYAKDFQPRSPYPSAMDNRAKEVIDRNAGVSP